MSKARAVMQGKRIVALDVLGEVRRAQKILRRVEKYLSSEQRRAARRPNQGAAPRVGLTAKGRELLARDELAGQA